MSFSQITQVDSPVHHIRKTSETLSRPQSSYFKKAENHNSTNRAPRSTQPCSPMSVTHKRSYTATPMALQIQRSNSLSIYNTLKEQKKNIFITSTNAQNGEDINTAGSTTDSPKNGIKIVVSTKDVPTTQTAGPTKNLALNFSPRKKLFFKEEQDQAKRKKLTMKELLVRSNSISLKNTGTPKKNSPERETNQQEDDSESFEQKFRAGFNQKIEIYNKYYTAYLLQPEVEFQTREDLKVKTQSFITPKNSTLDSTGFHKNLRAMQTKSPLLHNNFDSFSGYADKVMNNTVSVDNSPHFRSPNNFKSKLRDITASPALEVKKTVDERVTKIKQMFSENKGISEDWTNGLKKMHDSLHKAKDLTDDQEIFMASVKDGKLFLVEAMVKRNPTLVNIVDGRNQTPLHWAVKRNHTAIIEFLCKQGADIDAADIVGRTPVDIAKRFENHKVLKLLEHGKEHQEVRAKLRSRSRLVGLTSISRAIKKFKKPIS